MPIAYAEGIIHNRRWLCPAWRDPWKNSKNRAVMDELDKIGYRGYLTFEYFHPYPHYPEALIYQTSDSLGRIMGRISRRVSSLSSATSPG